MSIASEQAYDQYDLLLRGAGAALRDDRAAANTVSNLHSTILLEDDEFGAVVVLVVPCFSRKLRSGAVFCSSADGAGAICV